MNVGKETKCPICKKKFIEHSELQDKICKMICFYIIEFFYEYYFKIHQKNILIYINNLFQMYFMFLKMAFFTTKIVYEDIT